MWVSRAASSLCVLRQSPVPALTPACSSIAHDELRSFPKMDVLHSGRTGKKVPDSTLLTAHEFNDIHGVVAIFSPQTFSQN